MPAYFLPLSALLLFGIASFAEENPSLSRVQVLTGRTRDQYEAFSRKAVISTQGTYSTKAGIEILKKGGNLFDAFTAVSFAIGVERPQSTGIGGGGFLVFYHAREKKVYAVDFREMAPGKAKSDMFLDEKGEPTKKSLAGALAVATPGLVAGVLEIQKKYGKLPLSEVLKPAIELAEKGFPVYPALHDAIKTEKENLAKFPSSKQIFLNADGEPWPVGHMFIQTDLAKTMKEISAKGAKAFYQGEIADKIVSTMRAHSGIIDKKDLAGYKVKWRKPVTGRYKDFEIHSMPPPSSGGTHVIQILNMVEKDKLAKKGPQDPQSIHLIASAMQRAFVDRAVYMGDPDFVKVPVDKIISKTYAAKLRRRIGEQAQKSKDFDLKEESPETTHFSMMDKDGNVIASTQTINGFFGSALVVEGTGIVLNNEMDDFAAKVGASNLFGAIGGDKNLIVKNKRPLSSMSPTIVMKNGKPFLAVGTPSGTRIITCVAQTLLNVLEFNQPLWSAVSLVRYHHQWMPDQISVEAPGFSPEVVADLQKRGHNVVAKDLGCKIQAIQREGDKFHGVSDMREEGLSLGL